MNLLEQTAFEPETGMPRWGCWVDSYMAAAQLAAGVVFDEQTARSIHNDALVRPNWSGEHRVLQVVRHPAEPGNDFELILWDPTKLIEIALGYIGTEWRGRQYPDLETRWPASKPRDFDLTHTLVCFRRPGAWAGSEKEHAALCDGKGLNVLFNPDGKIELDPWNRNGRWRGIQIWKA
jgi:hypothetical protein